MTLTSGTRLGPYEVIAPLGAGGMSACGHAGAPSAAPALGWRAEPRTCDSEARCQRQFALEVGPQRQWKSACGHTEPRTCESEARCQRQFALGVGPQRQWRTLTPSP
jgi:hypothetical protein